MNKKQTLLRKTLNGIYTLSGGIAALFLVAILCLIVAQMVCRWFGINFPGSNNYAGYCMAASSFFGLAYALNRNSHIRVSLLLNATKGWVRHVLDVWCLGFAVFMSGYFSFFAVKGVRISQMIHDVSQGRDGTPLWIPQLALAIGALVFTLALFDHFVHTVANRDHTFDHQPESDGEF